MKNEDLYWLAGWLEGEGSFMKGPPSMKNKSRIVGASTDLDVISKICLLLGVSVYKQKRRKNDKPHYKPVYSFTLVGERAVELMKILKPLMGERRQVQIDNAINDYIKPINKKRSPELVDKILTMAKTMTQTAIAKELSIDRTTINKIINHAIVE